MVSKPPLLPFVDTSAFRRCSDELETQRKRQRLCRHWGILTGIDTIFGMMEEQLRVITQQLADLRARRARMGVMSILSISKLSL